MSGELSLLDASLRSALRSHTSAAHQQLDTVVGPLNDVACYRRFICQSYRFRQAVECAGVDLPHWRCLRIAGALRQDLDDLAVGELTVPALPASLEMSINLGRLYVLEGSSVGARQLRAQARQLGFSATSGARHLAAQTDDVGRWRLFIAMLDSASNVDRALALRAAQDLFEFALSIYSEAVDD